MLKVNEIFYSLQGEGFNSGLAAVFVRLSGCNRACSWCDTKYHAIGSMMREEEILMKAELYPARWLIITGGEPTIQKLGPLVKLARGHGYALAIETNGDNELVDQWDWITCSPKDLHGKIAGGDELKLVYTGREDPELYRTAYPEFEHHYLQPCSGTNIYETIQYIKDHPGWRLSLQCQKLINIR